MNASTAAARTPPLQTKFPTIGTTIFTVMSQLAAETGAVNLGQGFPDFDCDPKLVAAVAEAMARGLNQYPPMTGAAPLREAIAAKIEALYGRRYDAAAEITVTAGATQAIITAILSVGREQNQGLGRKETRKKTRREGERQEKKKMKTSERSKVPEKTNKKLKGPKINERDQKSKKI